MSRSGAQLQSSEQQVKFMSDRVNKIENCFGHLCDTLASMNRKNAKLRDRGDNLSKFVMAHADSESINKSTKKALRGFATEFSKVQNYRDVKVKRTDTKVIKPLCEYDKKCKSAKKDVQNGFSSQKREIKEYQQLQKLRQATPSNSLKISAAEDRLKKARVDALHSTRMLEKNMESFEQQKVIDLKTVLGDYVHIEMMFHAKALEKLAKCYECLNIIDPDDDIEMFRSTMKDFGVPTIDGDADEEEGKDNSDTRGPVIYSEPMVISPRRDRQTTLTKEYRDVMYDDDDDEDDGDLSDYDDDETTTAR